MNSTYDISIVGAARAGAQAATMLRQRRFNGDARIALEDMDP